MSPADTLNTTLSQHHATAWACLSTVGRRLFFPSGIPAQSADAKSCTSNATIGQVTDGRGGALVLPAIAAGLTGLDLSEASLYAPQGGRPDVRHAWARHIADDTPPDLPGGAPDITLPVITSGLTHALSLAAQLFVDPGTPVLVPAPCWGNYAAIFDRVHGAQLKSWDLLRTSRGPRGWLDLDALAQQLAGLKRPGMLVLNFPSNPLGYSPGAQEVDDLIACIAQTPVPLTVICDDAYQGMWWEPDIYRHSVFHRLTALPSDRILAIKVDGATKELFYFGGRVGFMSFAASGPAGAVLEEKARAAARASVSSVSATAQAVLAAALRDPGLSDQQDTTRNRLQGRYRLLKRALADAGLAARPFNSGMFAVVDVPGDPETLRQTLLVHGIGVISLPEIGALRLSYGSLASADVPLLVQTIARHAH